MNYIDEGNTLPVPFNMIPSPKSFKYVYVWLKEVLVGDTSRAEEKAKRQTFIKVSNLDLLIFYLLLGHYFHYSHP